jgi:hypothetical protein
MTCVYVSFSCSKKNLCEKQREKESIVTRTHEKKNVLRITLSLINIFSFRVQRKEKKRRREGIKSQMTIHLSFIDNRDVITTTTTLDTSNNIYQMVRIKHLFSFSKKTKSFFFRQLFNLMIKVFKPILVFDMLVR